MPRGDDDILEEEAPASTAGGDVEMVEGTEAAEVTEVQETVDAAEMPFAEENIVDPKTTFVSYLMSPVVSLTIGSEFPTVLTAHQALLTQSPYFSDACKDFADDSASVPLTEH